MAAAAMALVATQIVMFIGGGLRRTGRRPRDWRPRPSRRLAVVAALFLVGDALYVLGPLTALIGVVPILSRPVAVGVVGVILFLISAAFGLSAQREMGEAWAPVGASTKLVTTGPFRFVRHPIYTGLIGMSSAIVLVIPTAVTIAALLVFVVTVELEARLVEERYLLHTQPDYGTYAATTGRFVPGIGRLLNSR